MPSAPDLLRRLAQVAADLAPALVPVGHDEALTAVTEAARAGFGAAAASIAVLDEPAGELLWRAAAGAGAEATIGLRLPIGAGIAGYVAATGQSLIVDDVRRDPRFDADVAARTGYVPVAIAAVPIVDGSGQVLGVLSVLDRAAGQGDLDLAARLADVAAAVLPLGIAVGDLGRVLVGALAEAVAEGDRELAAALRRRAARPPAADADLTALAASFAELRALGGRERRAALRLVDGLLDYARSRRR